MPKSYTAPAKGTKKAAQAGIKVRSSHPLAGEWVNGFEEEDDVRIVVSGNVEDFKIRVVDKHGDEKADVYDAKWDGESLTYNIYWNSTGRFLRCRMQAMGPNRVGYTYTYTATEMWRKETK